MNMENLYPSQNNYVQEARSALHLAAESGNADICEMLLAKNAYVNSKTKAGWTPLHYVAYNGFNELIHPLVAKHNAAIDATSMVSESKLQLVFRGEHRIK